METIKITALSLVILVLTACAATGYIPLESASKELIAQHVVQGKTTKPRIVKCFGNATSITFNHSGHEVWVYKSHNSNSNDSFSSVKELVVIFDQNGVVSEYSVK